MIRTVSTPDLVNHMDNLSWQQIPQVFVASTVKVEDDACCPFGCSVKAASQLPQQQSNYLMEKVLRRYAAVDHVATKFPFRNSAAQLIDC